MSSNTGKPSELAFIAKMEAIPKTVVFRLRDAADLFGLNKRKVAIFALPSDFVIVSNGLTFFAEVKSTQNKTSFSLDALSQSQKSACVRVTSCGGIYLIFIHNLITNKWYKMTGREYIDLVKLGNKSIKWEFLYDYD